MHRSHQSSGNGTIFRQSCLPSMNLRRLPSLPHWLIPSARLRIRIIYWWRHGRLPRLTAPVFFTEWVQQRKLQDRNPAMPRRADKIAVKDHVALALGPDWVIPNYWTGTHLPREPHWPYPFIVKASHGCNQNAVCHTPADWRRARKRAAGWLAGPYGLWLDEWAYRAIPRRLVVEPFLGEDGALPRDYKIYVFGGVARFVQVHLERGRAHRWFLFDLHWQQLSQLHDNATPSPALAPPVNLAAMLKSAETLAAPFDFVRVDFYEIPEAGGPVPKFGEITFYPGSGLDPFDPLELDALLGAYWQRARDDRHAIATVANSEGLDHRQAA